MASNLSEKREEAASTMGYDWAGIIDRQKAMFAPKDEGVGGTKVCGRTCHDWIAVLGFLAVFYAVTAGFTTGSYYVYKVAILDKHPEFTQRTAFKFGNDKIPMGHKMMDLKNIVDNKIGSNKIISSPLDFPMLTFVPRRYGTDDKDEGDERSLKYKRQMEEFFRPHKKMRNNATLCGDGYAFVNDIKMDVEKKYCRLDDNLYDKAIGIIRNGDNNFEINNKEELNPMDNRSTSIFVKLNNVIGFIPVPPDNGTRLKELIDKTKTYQNYKEIQFVYPVNENQYVSYNEGILPIFCWFYGHKAGKKDVFLDLKKEVDEEFLNNFVTLTNNGIPMKHFPFTGQFGFAQGISIMDLKYPSNFEKFKNLLKEEIVFVIECRAIAENIPYEYKIDVAPKSKYGHFKLQIKLYQDQDYVYMKIEK